MAGRKAPRPLPRPVRWLAMFLALVFVVSLGMVVNHESSKAHFCFFIFCQMEWILLVRPFI